MSVKNIELINMTVLTAATTAVECHIKEVAQVKHINVKLATADTVVASRLRGLV